MRGLVLAFVLLGCDDGRDYGGVCTSNDDCAEDLGCRFERCVYVCSAANNYACPAGFNCLSSREVGATGACVAVCSVDADCPDRFHCNLATSYCTVE